MCTASQHDKILKERIKKGQEKTGFPYCIKSALVLNKVERVESSALSFKDSIAIVYIIDTQPRDGSL